MPSKAIDAGSRNASLSHPDVPNTRKECAARIRLDRASSPSPADGNHLAAVSMTKFTLRLRSMVPCRWRAVEPERQLDVRGSSGKCLGDRQLCFL